MRFWMLMDCESCGEEMYIGPCLTALERDGLPVIPFDLAAQETFTCDCGTAHYTGDFDVMVEEGDEEGEDGDIDRAEEDDDA